MANNKINMKVRFRSGKFWVGIISVLAVFVTQISLAFGLDVSQQVEQVLNISNTILVLLAGFGVITDPSVKGLGDSDLVLAKDRPTDPNRNIVDFDEEETVMGTDDQMISEVDYEDDPLMDDIAEEKGIQNK